MTEDIEGYSLFDDITDKSLQRRNRIVTLVNIAEDYLDGDGVSEQGQHLFMLYWERVGSSSMREEVAEELRARDLLGFL